MLELFEDKRGGISREAEQRMKWLMAIADPVRLHILETLSRVPDASAAELAARGQTSDQTLRRHLEAMNASGVICVCPGRSDGETSGRPAARYGLAPDIRHSVCSTLGVPTVGLPVGARLAS